MALNVVGGIVKCRHGFLQWKNYTFHILPQYESYQ